MALMNVEAIQKLYVAYFNRPADYYGLQYWDKVVTAANGSTTAVAAAFASSQEYKDTYAGMDLRNTVNAIYKNLFGHSADIPGLDFWTNAVQSGAMTLSNAVTQIASGAQNADKVAYASKVAAASAFTNSLDTTDEILGYSGVKANAEAKKFIAGVTDATTLASAISQANLDASIGSVVGSGTTAQTFTLTKGLDVITGSAGNDRIIASIDVAGSEVNTLNAVDSIDGGAGVDTLVIAAATALGTSALANIKNVEVIEVQAAGSIALDTTGVAGVTNVNVTRAGGAIGVTAASTTDIGLNLKASAAPTTLLGGKNVNVNLTDVTATAGAVTVGSTAAAATGTVVVSMTGQAVAAGGTSTIDLAGVTVVGGKSVNVTEKATSSSAAIATDVNVAHTVKQGDVSVTGTSATTDVSVKQDASQFGYEATAAVAAKATTQEITFNAIKAGDTVTLSTGGNIATFARIALPSFGDTLSFTAKKDLTAAEVASAFANLLSGAVQGNASAQLGIYSSGSMFGDGGGLGDNFTSGAVQTVSATQAKIVFTSTNIYAELTAMSSGSASDLVSAASVSAGVNGVAADAGVLTVANGKVTIDDVAGSIKTLTIDGYGDASTVSGGAALATLNLSHSGFTYDGNGSAMSTADITVADTAATLALNLNNVGSALVYGSVALTQAPTTLNVGNTGTNYIELAADATETLNVSGSGDLMVGSSGLGLKTVKVSGSAGLDLSYVEGTASTLTSVDTTGTTGAVAVSIQGDRASYAGGAGADHVTITNASTAVTKSIDLGAGDDVLDLSATLAIDPTVELKGGAGTDTIVLSAAAAAARSAGVTFQDKISGFEKLQVGTVSASATVNLDNLDDINYVVTTGSENGAASTFAPSIAQGNATTTESATFSFGALTAGQSYTVAGRTVTATGAATVNQVTAAMATGNAGSAALTVTGTLSSAWTMGSHGTNYAQLFSATPNANVTDIGYSSSGLVTPNLLTLDKMLANATVELRGSGDVAIQLADAAGTADRVNLVASAESDTYIGSVTADKVETIAITAIDTDTSSNDGVPNVSTNNLVIDADAATTITVGGAGNLMLSLSADTKAVTLIDGSAATGILTVTTNAGDTGATTVKGGSGADVLVAKGANDVLLGGAGNDVLKVVDIAASAVTLTGGEGVDQFDVSGFLAANAGAAVTITDLAKGETIKFAVDPVANFVSSKVSLIGEATFDNYVTEAAKAADAATGTHGGVAWFQFNGNTFVVQDVNGDAAFTNGSDIIVKLTGIVDLSASSFNNFGEGTLKYL